MHYVGMMIGVIIGMIIWKNIMDVIKWPIVEHITYGETFKRAYFVCGGIVMCWVAS